MIESQDQSPDLGKVSTHSVDSLSLQTKRLHKLETLVDDDRNTGGRRLLLAQWDPRHLVNVTYGRMRNLSYTPNNKE